MANSPFPTIKGGDGTPPEPEWRLLHADEDDIALAQHQWGEVIREMREAGTPTASNGHSIRRLIEFRVQYERMARHVAEHGPVIKAKRSKFPQYNPHWIVMRQADENIRAGDSQRNPKTLSRLWSSDLTPERSRQ